MQSKAVPVDDQISLNDQTYLHHPTPVIPAYALLPSMFQEGTIERNYPSRTTKKKEVNKQDMYVKFYHGSSTWPI
jgi:hypothetical protein